MRNLITAVLLVSLLASCRLPSVVDMFGSDPVLDCGGDPRKEQTLSNVILLGSHFNYGDVGYVAVFIKHSSRHAEGSGSRFVTVSATNNIKLLDAFESQLLEWHDEVPDARLWLAGWEQRYHVPLDNEYRALIRFEFLGMPDEEAVLTIGYTHNLTGLWTFSVNHNTWIRNGRVFYRVDSAEVCHPDVWNTIPDDGIADVGNLIPDDESIFTADEIQTLKDALKTGGSEHYKAVLASILATKEETDEETDAQSEEDERR